MNIDDVKRLSATQSPSQMAGTFYKKFKHRPHAMLHAHKLAAHVARTKAANARTGELRGKVRELMKNNSALSLHEAYRRAGVALGIL
jgi:hypothetical protein